MGPNDVTARFKVAGQLITSLRNHLACAETITLFVSSSSKLDYYFSIYSLTIVFEAQKEKKLRECYTVTERGKFELLCRTTGDKMTWKVACLPFYPGLAKPLKA